MTFAMAMILGAGKDQVPISANYSEDGGLKIVLDKEVKLCKMEEILQEYGIDTSAWPEVLKNVAKLDVWLWVLEFMPTELGKATLTPPEQQPASILLTEFVPSVPKGSTAKWTADTIPPELKGATIEKVVTGTDASYKVKKDGKPSGQYEVKLYKGTATLRQKTYKIVISGHFETPLDIIPGMLCFKTFTIGLTNMGQDMSGSDLLLAKCQECSNILAKRFRNEQEKLAGGISQMPVPALPVKPA